MPCSFGLLPTPSPGSGVLAWCRVRPSPSVSGEQGRWCRAGRLGAEVSTPGALGLLAETLESRSQARTPGCTTTRTPHPLQFIVGRVVPGAVPAFQPWPRIGAGQAARGQGSVEVVEPDQLGGQLQVWTGRFVPGYVTGIRRRSRSSLMSVLGRCTTMPSGWSGTGRR